MKRLQVLLGEDDLMLLREWQERNDCPKVSQALRVLIRRALRSA